MTQPVYPKMHEFTMHELQTCNFLMLNSINIYKTYIELQYNIIYAK